VKNCTLDREDRSTNKKIGLALGSGSARGWAHIGVIKALAETGIKIDYVAGTSIGAVVGAFYASGRIAALEDAALQIDWRKIVFFLDAVYPKSGLIEGKKVAEFIRTSVKEKNIEDLSLPFCAVSTDLASGNEVIIRNGDIIEAVRASISVPGIFTPVTKDNTILVDGALINPVPVSVVRQMGADLVIAVDLNHYIVGKKGISGDLSANSGTLDPGKGIRQEPAKKNRALDALNKRLDRLDNSALMKIRQWMSKEPALNIFDVIISSINIMETQITASRLKTDRPDILIRPRLGHIGFMEFNKAGEAIEEGYREARTCISEKLA